MTKACLHPWRVFKWDAEYFEAEVVCKDCGEFIRKELNQSIPSVLAVAIGHLRGPELVPWERQFVFDLKRNPKSLTAVQLKMLRDINERIRGANKLEAKG